MKKTIEKVKRGRGRPKTNQPTKDTLLNIRLSDIEVAELKILQRDTKADTMTALIRNFISIGAYALAHDGRCLKQNEIYYKRFFLKWDGQKHLSDYSDEYGLIMKEQKKKNVNK